MRDDASRKPSTRLTMKTSKIFCTDDSGSVCAASQFVVPQPRTMSNFVLNKSILDAEENEDEAIILEASEHFRSRLTKETTDMIHNVYRCVYISCLCLGRDGRVVGVGVRWEMICGGASQFVYVIPHYLCVDVFQLLRQTTHCPLDWFAKCIDLQRREVCPPQSRKI